MRNASIKLATLVLMIFTLTGCSGLDAVDTKLGEIFSYFESGEKCLDDAGVCTVEIPKTDETEADAKQTDSKTDIKKLTNKDKLMIDKWLTDNGYNRYGDPADTIYMGGTPLFDEKTGESIDRFDYILERHPDILGNIK